MKILFLLFFQYFIFAQEYDVTPFLKKIEEGKRTEIKNETSSLLKKNPADPSLLFIDAILTENAEQAVNKYQTIVDKYPKSKYADASVFRIYSYYYSIGNYQTAKNYLQKLKDEYSNSPYLKAADRSIPSENEFDNSTKSETKSESKSIRMKFKEKYRFTIQAGAFLNEKNAEGLKEDLENLGFDVEIKEKIIAGTSLKVVLVGKFEDKSSAEAELLKINKEFKLNGKVIELDS